MIDTLMPPALPRSLDDVHATVGAVLESPVVSVILMVTERPEPLDRIYEEYTRPLRERGWSFECVVAAFPYWKSRLAALDRLIAAGEPIRLLEAARNVGATGLLRLALPETRGTVVLTLPAYRQVMPEAIPALVDRVLAGDECVVARRTGAGEALVNRLQHRVLNALVGGLGSGKLHDVGSGVRAARRDALLQLPLYGELSRFLPLLAVHHGLAVSEVPSAQHPDDMQRRVYSPGFYVRRAIDVLGLFFLLRFTDKPLRFFGLVGAVLSLLGAGTLVVVAAQRLAGEPLADRPLLLLGVLLVTIGLQSIALGLIGEMIVHFNAPRGRRYRLRRER